MTVQLLRATLVLLVPALVSAAELTRGPYPQNGSSSAMTLVWRTDASTDAKVELGPRPDALSRVITSANQGTQHEIRIEGLEPSTRYYYAVGTGTERLKGGDAEHFFETAPPGGTRTKFRAWVVGDSGTGQAAQAAVRDAMLRDVGADRPDIYLHLGDMAYTDGTDPQFQTNFFDPYQLVLRNTVVWPTLGNHEARSANSAEQSGPYYDAYVLPKNGEAGGVPSGTEAYYSFDYANVHFVVLDSEGSSREPGGEMLTWLKTDLAATTQDWIIAFFHHPPYSKGSHDSDTEGKLIDMREHALPILEAHGVDLVLAGHSHIYERSYLLDGAYETPSMAGLHILDSGDGRPLGTGPYAKRAKTAHDGTVYVVAGHGGAGISSDGQHPLMFMTEKKHGSALLDIDGDVLTLVNVRADGVRSDSFTILKAQGLVLASPNGGEQLKAGTTHTIRWASKGERTSVHLDYSTDEAKTWKPIASSVPNSGEYAWTVPAITSLRTLVRVRDANDPDVDDVSDAAFLVYEGNGPPPRPNRPPEVTTPKNVEGQVGHVVVNQLQGADPDGDSLTWTLEPFPEGASLTGNAFLWIPTREQAGVWNITVTADDEHGGRVELPWVLRLADENGVVPEEASDARTTPAKQAGCGCAGAGSAGFVLLGVLSLLLLRRRRASH